MPKVEIKGLEPDGAYTGIRNVNLRFAASYTDAVYKAFPNSARPVENAYTTAGSYQDVTGQALPGASRWNANFGGDDRVPAFSGLDAHVRFNTAVNSRYNSDVSLSKYGWVGGSAVTDPGFGIGPHNGAFDLSVIVKNAFNNRTPLAQTWNTITPAVRRWVGVTLAGKL